MDSFATIHATWITSGLAVIGPQFGGQLNKTISTSRLVGQNHSPRLSEEPGPNDTAVDTSTLTLGPYFEDQVKWRLSRAPEASKPTTCHYVPQALLTCLSAKSKTDLLR